MSRLLTVFFLFALLSTSAQDVSDIDQIKLVMTHQETAWNNGDLVGFMNGYWESDSLIFVGKSGPTYGWQQTLDNYKKGYSSPQEMGVLTFTNLEFIPLENNHMLVVGKWHLARTGLEDLEGHYSLVWERKKDGWVIIADHSS